MRKVKSENGFSTIVFEKGDGMKRRYKKHLEEWRVRMPEYRKLRHAVAWYMEEEHLVARPLIGLSSLADFAEHLLWRTQRICQGSHLHAKATRLFLIVRRRLVQLANRGRMSKRSRINTAFARATIRHLLPLARSIHEALPNRYHAPNTWANGVAT